MCEDEREGTSCGRRQSGSDVGMGCSQRAQKRMKRGSYCRAALQRTSLKVKIVLYGAEDTDDGTLVTEVGGIHGCMLGRLKEEELSEV